MGFVKRKEAIKKTEVNRRKRDHFRPKVFNYNLLLFIHAFCIEITEQLL